MKKRVTSYLLFLFLVACVSRSERSNTTAACLRQSCSAALSEFPNSSRSACSGRGKSARLEPPAVWSNQTQPQTVRKKSMPAM